MKAKKLSQNKFAKKLGLTPGRVSQILNNPGNLTLETMALWARKLGGKVEVSYYEDGDTRNQRGPINGEVFRLCWERAGRPIYMREVESLPQVAATNVALTPSPISLVNIPYRGRHSEWEANVKANTRGTTIALEMATLHSVRREGTRFEKEGPVS